MFLTVVDTLQDLALGFLVQELALPIWETPHFHLRHGELELAVTRGLVESTRPARRVVGTGCGAAQCRGRRRC